MKKCLFLIITILCTVIVYSQNDSLVLKNGNVIVGELKTMDRGVATFKTDYSDSDFKIEWDGIKEMYTNTSFLITTTDGDRFNGNITSSDDNSLKINLENGGSTEVVFMDIVFLKSVDEGFWQKIDAFVDVGLDMAKANNQTTFSTRSGIEYMAPLWSLGLTFNTNFTRQTEGPDNDRTDGGLTYSYFLPKDFYIPVSVTYLKSTEQNLNSRWNFLGGVGYYFLHTNRLYWGAATGVTYNMENYSLDSIGDKNSIEGYIGTDMNLFDIGDLSLSTTVKVFPSFTESGRWRTDFNFNTKYDLPLEFYIKIGFSLNYDNKPAVTGTELDYTLHTGIGWEWP